MYGGGKSDRPVVPGKDANKANGKPFAAERPEGRGLAKENPGEQSRSWTQGQIDPNDALDRIRKAAKGDRKQRFTALWHHVYNVNRLRQAFFALKREASPGVDGTTWVKYRETLESNLKDLSGRFAASNRAERGEGKPETFNFLGFVHICGQTRKGQFCVLRKTIAKRVAAKLKDISVELRKRINHRIADVGQWLKSVLSGHYQYYGVPRNYKSLRSFRRRVVERWRSVLRRRSDKKHKVTWDRMEQLAELWLPKPRIVHPYPSERLHVIIQGRSPVR